MPMPVTGQLRDLLTEAVHILEHNPPDDRFRVASVLVQVLESSDPNVVAWATEYLLELQPNPAEAEARPRPAYDQNEQDELAWCIECGQVCGHAGHRHASGDHGEIVCEQCGITLSP
jgi:hypothetical protein